MADQKNHVEANNGQQLNESLNNNNTNNNGTVIPTAPEKPLRSILKLKISDSEDYVPEKPSPHEDIVEKHHKVPKKRVDKTDLGENFVPPDGGWGWMVAAASGVNILVTFALAQQFGIIFRGRMQEIGVSSSELTSIINIQVAVSAFTGLLNGPLFRNFTYRQVALVGSFLTFLGLFLLIFADSFEMFVVSFSVLYAIGRGFTGSASSLAVNTYFKQKRRNATAYQFGVAGLGPIFYPYLATFLMTYYGVQGTVLIFAGLALHTVACSLIYQPVLWHVKKIQSDEEATMLQQPDEEDEIIEPCEPDTPILPRANDGWYGSRTSLSTLPLRRSPFPKKRNHSESGMTEMYCIESTVGGKSPRRSMTFNLSPSILEELDDETHYDQAKKAKADAIEARKLAVLELQEKERLATELEKKELEENERQKRLPFYKKIVIFFDLGLLRDITYINLACGLMMINFVEINFAILTPFILSDFGFNNNQLAFAMSALGTCDLIVRFLVPLITSRFKRLSNQLFFSIGILGMCIGRFILVFTRDFYTLVAVFLFLGLSKAFRTVFWTLIIPSYVPLKRLPAASGLQLLMSGIFSMACGPLVGHIRDNTNFGVTLIFLNCICIVALLMWTVEVVIRKVTNNPKTTLNGD